AGPDRGRSPREAGRGPRVLLGRGHRSGPRPGPEARWPVQGRGPRRERGRRGDAALGRAVLLCGGSLREQALLRGREDRLHRPLLSASTAWVARARRSAQAPPISTTLAPRAARVARKRAW